MDFLDDGEGHVTDRVAGKVKVVAGGLAQLLILDVSSVLQESLLGFILRLPDVLSSADLTLNAVNYTRGVTVY